MFKFLIIFISIYTLHVNGAASQNTGFQQFNPFNYIPGIKRQPQQAQPAQTVKTPLMTMAEDPIMFDGFDMKNFLCSGCRFLVSVSKRYFQQNQNSQQLIDFLQQQHYYDELKEKCQQEFDKSGARGGKFFGCQTILIQSVTDVQQKILEIGTNLPTENNQICFEKGVGACKTSILSSITGK